MKSKLRGVLSPSKTGTKTFQPGRVCKRTNSDGSTTTYTSQGGSRPCPHGGVEQEAEAPRSASVLRGAAGKKKPAKKKDKCAVQLGKKGGKTTVDRKVGIHSTTYKKKRATTAKKKPAAKKPAAKKPATRPEGVKRDGTLKKGYKYLKGGRVVKVTPKPKAKTARKTTRKPGARKTTKK